MRILVLDYGLCNFHNLISLAKDDHDVFVNSTEPYDKLPVEYFTENGVLFIPNINRESVLRKWIEHNKIELIISTSPSYKTAPRLSKSAEYIGLSEKSCRLEYNKLFVRTEVEKLGIKVPQLMASPTPPCVAKPNILSPTHDHVDICLTQEDIDSLDISPKGVFYEEYIQDSIETNVAYVMSKGKWSIMHTQQIIGEDLAKRAGGFTHWTKTSSFKNLSDEDEKIVLEQAKIYLDWASEYCSESSYVGQLTGLLKDGVWYFCENNVRPEQTNSLPYFISGDEWLEGMRGKPEIIGDAFPKDVHKMIVMPNHKDSVYPFHLHKRHNVAIPCGLDIIDNQYRVSNMMRGRSKDGLIGIVICDRVIPQEFIDDIRHDGNFHIKCILK